MSTKKLNTIIVICVVVLAVVLFVLWVAPIFSAPSGSIPAGPSATPSASSTPTAPVPSSTLSSTPTVTASPSAVPAANAIRSLHSPSVVTDDMHLSANQCHVVPVDAASGDVLPDPSCTPGGIDPAVTQDNIGTTICQSGYTTTVRASSSNTAKNKVISLSEYGMSYSKTTEYDHLISLELGGTNSVSNLWPEPNKSSATSVNNPKDSIENTLKRAVCAHQVTLAQAQAAIATNWVTALQTLNLG